MEFSKFVVFVAPPALVVVLLKLVTLLKLLKFVKLVKLVSTPGLSSLTLKQRDRHTHASIRPTTAKATIQSNGKEGGGV